MGLVARLKWYVGCWIGLLALAAPVRADELPRPLVVDVTTFAPEPRSEAVWAFIARTTPLKPGTYPLESVAGNELNLSLRWWIPSPGASGCKQGPPPISEYLAQGRQAWNSLDLEKGLAVLEEAQRSIPCQGELVGRQDLWDLIFLQGVIHFYLEDGLANGTFAEALALDPSLKPGSGYPPDIQAAFTRAAAQTRQAPWISLPVPSQLTEAGLVIDGQPVPTGVSSVSLQPGRHFVQAVGPEGQLRGEVFTVVPGDNRDLIQMTSILPARPQVISAMIRAQLAEGALDPLLTRGWSRYANARNHPVVMFVIPDPSSPSQMKVLTLIPGEEALLEGPPADLKPLPPMGEGSRSGADRSAPASREGGGLRLSTGLGILLYDGAAFGLVTPGLTLPAGPLEVALAGVFGFGSEASHLNGGRVGLQAPLRDATLRPYVGGGYSVVAARVVADGAGGQVLVLEGTPEFYGGADFLPSGRAHLSARVGAGFTPGLVSLGADVSPSSRLTLGLELSGGVLF